jgi:hypothetical protein
VSGYLTRLAERALNQAPMVHANARLPFVELPDPLGEVRPVRVETDTQASPRMVDAPMPQRSEARVELSVEAPAPRMTPSSPESMPVSRIERDSVRDATRATEPRHLEATVPDPSASVSRVTENRRREPVHVERAVASSNAASVDSSRVAPRASAMTAVPPIPPILGAAARKRETVPLAEPSQPDVHIHIGRIELTAVPEHTPSPRPARTAKKPMTLDEYLRGRAT